MHGVDRAAGRIGGDGGEQRRVDDAETHLLAFHVAAGLQRARRLVDVKGGERRIARGLGRVDRGDADQEHHAHDSEDGPALPLVADHAAEHVGQAGADGEDQQDLDEVGQRVGVLERMRRVGVEEAAAVGAQDLDDFLRSNRALCDDLLGAFQRGRLGIGAQVLRHALPNEHQSDNDRDRQQDVEHAAGQIDPEIAQGLHRAPRETAHQRNRQRDAGGRGDEVVHRQPGHLGQIAHGRFGHVGLPVGVGDEADRGVEREIGPDRILARRIERQQVLQPLQPVQRDEAGERERQHGDRVGDPVLFLRLVDAAQPVDAALHRPQHDRQRRALAAEYAGHVAAEGAGDQQQQHAIQRDLQPSVDRHVSQPSGVRCSRTTCGGSARTRTMPTS